jgi:hypothetical protein
MDPAEGHEAPIGKTVAALFERFWKMQRARAVSLVLWLSISAEI